jgi:large conductance mechanosensitive channel
MKSIPLTQPYTLHWPEFNLEYPVGGGAIMFSGFRQFILRGNVIDLAVAVVIGGAFGAVVAALVKDLLTPLIGAIFGQPDFSALVLTINGSQFLVGDFLNAVITFVLIAAAVYFAIVVPVNAINARRNRGEAPPDPTTKKCPECLSEVPVAARRCAFCTSALA